MPGPAAAPSADPTRAARRSALAVALGLGIVGLAAPARADDQQAFELAKNPFDAGQFAEAHARLGALLDPSLPACDAASSSKCRIADPDLVERARALDAASLLALKREAEADAQIAKILRKNPQYAPSPALFPQEVIDRFTVVRGQLRPELEAIAQQKAKEELAKRVAAQKAREAEQRWIADLEARAAEERYVRPNSRWIAMVPFGVGQFQNGSTALGVVFAVGEVLLGGASLVLVAVSNSVASGGYKDEAERVQQNAKLISLSTANQVTFTAWAAAMVGGVVQAQVGFVPESTTIKQRPVPTRPKIAPVAAPVPGGAVFGLGGTF